ncbi:MAG: nitric-oxide reductase large subunit [Deltaproteobacteria bacterium]|nr:nitric-oxide reductase large subunit [Deltaproteobacteria bacterium]
MPDNRIADKTYRSTDTLSPWWKRTVVLIMIGGFSVLLWVSGRTYTSMPPVPGKVINTSGKIIFTDKDIIAGQEVFLKYGLMDNGTIWGHGAYVGPDFSAQYLHTLFIDARNSIANKQYNRNFKELNRDEQIDIQGEVRALLKTNRYNPETGTLLFTDPEELSYYRQIKTWTNYFQDPADNGGLPVKYINNSDELRSLVAFFAWTAWASVTNRPGKDYSYTNNFPYDPEAGNIPPPATILWSTLSIITLLAGIAVVLFVFGKFDYLGWKDKREHVHPQMMPGSSITESQKATIKFFTLSMILFLAQVFAGGAVAHYKADASSFYGFNLSDLLPSNILRTWHLQLMFFWIITAYIGGGLFLAPVIGKEFKKQKTDINILFVATGVVIFGSLLGEFFGINQLLGKLWFWFGIQGLEYLELGRVWQFLLIAGLVLWVIIIYKAVAPVRNNPDHNEIPSLFLSVSVAIPLFYLPAVFFTDASNFSVIDVWRFWIIHLWVEGFLELFATVMVATIFYQLGLVSHQAATRVIYLDAILYLGSGIIGTGHHWYWTGQTNITLALAAMFSAMEVVPLTLLTLDAWDFIKLTRRKCDICGKDVSIPHKWTFYFLMSVGFWNFVGAGIFGFLINLPIVSYFEAGTMLTPNHAHAAMMGVFGMLAMGLMFFVFREVLTDKQWEGIEKYVKFSFWGLNIGLTLMVVTNLFPGGVLQLLDVLKNGYWHARGPEFLHERLMHILEWLRLPGDAIFIGIGVIPAAIAALITFRHISRSG